MQAEKKLTVGIIGNGKSANRYHIPFLLTRKETIKLKTIYARSLQKKDWAHLPEVCYTNQIQTVLDDPEIDLVVITTPVTAHAELAEEVLRKQKHCLVEKPFVMCQQQAEALFRLADEKHVTLMCYQNRRFDSDYLTVKTVLASGCLGRLTEVEMNYDYYRPEVPLCAETYRPEDSFLYQHGAHMIDQALALFGSPEQVYYDVRQLLGAHRMNDYYDIDLMYEGWKVSLRSSYFRVKSRPKFVLYGTRGMFVKRTDDKQEQHLKLFACMGAPGFGIDTPEEYGTLTYYDDAGCYHEEKVPSERGDYGLFYDALYRTIICHELPLVTPDQTLEQLRILERGAKGLV